MKHLLLIETAVMWLSLALLAGVAASVFLPFVARRLARVLAWVRRQGPIGGIVLGVFSAALVIYGATKKPNVSWDIGIKDNGSDWIVEGSVTNGVAFKWTKTDPTMPDTVSLQFLYQLATSEGEDWTVMGEAPVGNLAASFSLADANKYRYAVCHDWVPPSPVHTNGVWLGSVIERAKGETGVSKMVIIKGKLYKDGVQIAPVEVK